MMESQTIQENSEKLLAKLANLSEEELSKLVLIHNQKYFFENEPEITDEAFDKLVEALRFKNANASVLQEIGPKVSYQYGDEVIHREPMLSLEKCYDDATFFKWAKKITSDLVAMPKIDGVACSIKYDRVGKLIEASTRGDGRVGENITKNAMRISDLPLMLPKSEVESVINDSYLEIRGEIFLPISLFTKDFAEDFASPRNLAAGFLKLKEGSTSKNNLLRFFPYDVRNSKAKSEREKFELLERLGFSMMPWSVVKNDESATEIYLALLNERDTIDYEIDGVVFRADSIGDQMRLGETAHHPRYAMAYKFQGESAATKLVHVQWSVARSGIITPIAIVEPVFVSGASITRASLHNLRIFNDLDLREESLVEINRRGGVIPHLERVLSRKGAKIEVPHACPSCGGEVIIDGDFLRCRYPENCNNVLVSKLIYFVHVVGIEGLGEKIVRKLVEAGMLKRFGDIFRLKATDFVSLERMGDILAHKIMKEIDKAKIIPLAPFLRSLGISEIGSNISELLANNFHTLPKIRSLGVEDLLAIHGIGASIASSLVEGLKALSDDIEDLLSEITVTDQESSVEGVDSSHPLFGISVVFTGKMAHLERKSAQEAVKKLGGKAPEAISGNIDILVIGDEGSPLLGKGQKSTKQKAAEKLIDAGHQIKIMSESDFLKLIEKQI